MPHDRDDRDRNPNDPRRNIAGPEDNPFIAFRRFADSHVSSLVNTVFTLPATLANFNNAYHAREQCLFGRADTQKCERLKQLEDRAAQLGAQGRESYRAGDMDAVLAKSEELMRLEQETGLLRKDIVERARGTSISESGSLRQLEDSEKLGIEQGQHWGWSWSWGFPKSFDEDERTTLDEGENARWCRRKRDQALRERHAREQFEEDWEQLDAQWKQFRQGLREEHPEHPRREPKVWSWSFRWPPETNDPHSGKSTEERLENPYDEFSNFWVDEVNRMMHPRIFNFSNESYSPRALERDEQLRKSGIQWRDAFEDLVRAQQGASLLRQDQLGKSSGLTYNQWSRRFWDSDSFSFPQRPQALHAEFPRRLPWEGEESNEEPSYEYGHDHEDQHDEPPSPKVNQSHFEQEGSQTELDAYERLLGPADIQTRSKNTDQPSILSTLTTTERTMAPDGTVTTKVVLKKRFSDGKEETSETIHTQRGQTDGNLPSDQQQAGHERFSENSEQQASEAKRSSERKGGWFWSG